MSDPVTPNMNLVQPIVGVDSGISAANSYNANYTTIDQHNHSVGSGVQVTPSGININASLPFNNQAATGLGYANITTQGTGIPTPVNYSVYFSGNEFYVKDGAGNAVQITSGGNVNATTSGISSGTASASFVASVLVVNAASTTPANIQGGSVLLGNNTAGSKFLTLSPPNAMAANYQVFLPALPAATSIVAIDSSGNMSGAYTVDNSTIDINGSSQIEVKALGINTGQLAASAVTRSKQAAVGQQVSSSCGVFSTASGTYVDITNLSISITTTGRPVVIVVQGDGSTSSAMTTSGTNSMGVRLLRGASVIAVQNTSSVTASITVPNNLTFIDVPAAGTYTYKMQMVTAGGTVSFVNAILTAYEL